jgi:hypothetical protein
MNIAQVCNTTKQRVVDIIKEIFVKIIDLAKAGEFI